MLIIFGCLFVGIMAGVVGWLIHPVLKTRGLGLAVLLGVTGSLLGWKMVSFLQLADSPAQSAGATFCLFGAVIAVSAAASLLRSERTESSYSFRDRQPRMQ